MAVTFVYLLCPIMLINISQRLLAQAMLQKAPKIWTNLGLNYPFAPKSDFSGKVDYHNLCLSSQPNILRYFKKIFRVDHQIQLCTILPKIGSKLSISTKTDSLAKFTVTNVQLLYSLMPRSRAFFNYLVRAVPACSCLFEK